MIASEAAFLVLGLFLGIPAGAAIIAVTRSRPQRPHEVRLTITPNSVPPRRATTLAGDPFQIDFGTPARGGPADTSRHPGDPAALPSRARPVGPGALPSTAGNGASTGTPVRYPVGFDVRPGVDPVLAAIRADPTVARPALADRASGVARTADGSTSASRTAMASPPPAAGVALLERRVRVRAAAGTSGSRRAAALAALAARRSIDRPVAADEFDPSDGAAVEVRASDSRADGSGNTGGGSQPVAEAAGPCAEPRRVVDERCNLAERLRSTAQAAADSLHEAQRAYDTHAANADQAATIADARSQRAAKDAAQRIFRTDRSRAGSREQVEAAARTWLQEINRINESAREAAAELAREQAAAAVAMAAIERLTIEADAARVQAESAQESCQFARQALADCEEAENRRAAHMPLAPSLGPDEAPDEPEAAAAAAAAAETDAGATTIGVAGRRIASDEEEDALAAAAARGRPAIVRLLAGDRDTMQRVVVALAMNDAAEQRRWQLQLSELVDAIVARAIEACAFEFPHEHPFWGPFDRAQDRDIALALSSLGFRFDGLGGFADDRIPSQRELSLALGYAGLDPMRVRHWPTEAERGNLFREVKVAADEYIVGAASGLTLGELVTLLGRRADGLADLWNSWGRVRPLLIEPA